MQWSFNRGFLRYLHDLELQRLEQLVPHFEQAYTDHGNWHDLLADRRELRQLLIEALPRNREEPPPLHAMRDGEDPDHRLNRYLARFERRLVLLA